MTSFHSIKLRYSLLKYYYSLFIARRGRGTIFRPLFFEFPSEKEVYQEKILNQQFLIGSDLLITPILDPSTTIIEPYFPGKNGKWYNLFDGTSYLGGTYDFVENQLKMPPAVFLRAGAIIFRQDVAKVTSSYDLNDNYELSVALKFENSSYAQAQGKILAVKNLTSAFKIDRCGEINCFIDVAASYKNKEQLKLLNVSFYSDKESELEIVFMKKLLVYGIEDGWLHDLKVFKMSYEGQEVVLNRSLIHEIKLDDRIMNIEFCEPLQITKGVSLAFFLE